MKEYHYRKHIQKMEKPLSITLFVLSGLLILLSFVPMISGDSSFLFFLILGLILFLEGFVITSIPALL